MARWTRRRLRAALGETLLVCGVALLAATIIVAWVNPNLAATPVAGNLTLLGAGILAGFVLMMVGTNERVFARRDGCFGRRVWLYCCCHDFPPEAFEYPDDPERPAVRIEIAEAAPSRPDQTN
jgi:hypothetical protein